MSGVLRGIGGFGLSNADWRFCGGFCCDEDKKFDHPDEKPDESQVKSYTEL
jgi:hypothetical protein